MAAVNVVCLYTFCQYVRASGETNCGAIDDRPFRGRHVQWYLDKSQKPPIPSKTRRRILTDVNVRLLSLITGHPTDGSENWTGNIISRKRRPRR